MKRTFEDFQFDNFAIEVFRNLRHASQSRKAALKEGDRETAKDWAKEWDRAHDALVRRGYNPAELSLALS